jgi:hypothetical protein
MNRVVIPCACGSKFCCTQLILEVDEENKSNMKITIEDDKHEYNSWISLGDNGLSDFIKGIHKRKGRLEGR